TTAVGKLTANQERILMQGTTEEDELEFDAAWVGVIPQLTEWFDKTDSKWAREFLPQFTSASPCPACFRDRLNIKALAVHVETTATLPKLVGDARKRHALATPVGRFNLADFTRLDIESAVEVIAGLVLKGENSAIAGPIIKEVTARLGFLASVGLEYLSLDRKTATLSGGEAQRIRLASQVGSGIVGATYVLDEPTIGLHARDNSRLISTLRHLADIGNTVLVVEHDEEMIRFADHLIDVGPGPGVHGGTIVAQGSAEDLALVPESMTGLYLSGQREVEVPETRRPVSEADALVVRGAKHNNLKGLDVAFPLGGLVVVTGVSGSGKSTLVNDILLRAAALHVGRRARPGEHDSVDGLEAIGRVIEVDQAPIGRTPRSNPATYTDMMTGIRNLFASTSDAQIRGYKPGRFSFNVKGGRCPDCSGQGTRKIAMHFLPDVFVTCEVCHGSRYNAETLSVRYRSKSIADVLDMTIEDACEFFSAHPKLRDMCRCLFDVGLGYVTLGQPSTTLSGGEAQRVKLATELGKRPHRRGGQTLYILDEPTTGLHFEDVRKLVDVLHKLVEQGHTVVVIEHNLDVVKCADWVIDLGPEGGDGGGHLVATGTPETIAKAKNSHTGSYLAPLLA
ncbi:MAG: excinuclease ABC subunit A, partial [Myxococcota bacterium]